MDKNNHLWPPSARLRFKLNADVKPRFAHLRGTPVLVLAGHEDFGETNGGVRQPVFAFAGKSAWERHGYALPSQLEPFPDGSNQTQHTTADTPCEHAV